MKMFWFVFAEMKTDTFENVLVWMGPKVYCQRTDESLPTDRIAQIIRLILSLKETSTLETN